ncbi:MULTISPECIES: lytic transglycosylase domain-containing protein [unclassified Sphingomonas]|jgi:soluble lytic murein transglycosylase-like protein|uniref:lytic transglycosylase domain-containing protein n=1 Tax=unclassified Sphingomonas TaxID=196159 RepID=UPI000834463D|nr:MULTISPECIES: lytic transglycosylase domain-containing protein [unclassified Sphingomonas]
MFPRIAFIAGWLVLAAPVHAQTTTESSSPSPEERNGYRLAETADGFQLVEHGVWKAPQVNPAPASAPGPGAFGSQGAGPRHEGQARLPAGPNGFRRAAYLPHVYAAEAQFGLPAGLLDALIWTESRYNPFAVSKAGAAGLGQLMPGTAKELGVANRFDPLANLSGAARYLRQMLDRFGVVHLALAAYNAGPGAVERAKGIPRNGETPGYVRNVLARWRP